MVSSLVVTGPKVYIPIGVGGRDKVEDKNIREEEVK